MDRSQQNPEEQENREEQYQAVVEQNKKLSEEVAALRKELDQQKVVPD